MAANLEGAMRVFSAANAYVTNSGRLAEVEWQRNIAFAEFTETDLLRETAWVILCSGFRERVVRRVFSHISLCFCDWESASAILNADPVCRNAAMASFRSHTKLNAIFAVAQHINRHGFANLKKSVLSNPLHELQRLPYIGPVTVFHLAKNLGLDVAKPDRHLMHISKTFGFSDTDHFCTEIARESGEQRNVVDIIVWRFLADNRNALEVVNGISSTAASADCG